MPRIRCRYLDCIYVDDGYCSSETVEIDQDEGCVTFTLLGDAEVEEDWEEEKLEEIWDVEDDDLSDDDDLYLWLEEDL